MELLLYASGLLGLLIITGSFASLLMFKIEKSTYKIFFAIGGILFIASLETANKLGIIDISNHEHQSNFYDSFFILIIIFLLVYALYKR